ncbi:MAG: hypothetical protein M3340_11245, partial [Actinomycetota bacterium]|nr:hypothetical protein [Actinomycetota bacterium]
MERLDVAFVVPPFGDLVYPAVGVSTLQAALADRGRRARTFYFNLRLGAELGEELYRTLALDFDPSSLVGEWFFADAAFGAREPDGYARDLLEPGCVAALGERRAHEVEATLDAIRDARTRAGAFADACAAELAGHRPAIVG